MGQVVGFRGPEIMDISRLSYVLGRFLPQDIKINEICYSNLHPRFDALGKTYIYRCSYEDNLFLRPYALIIKKKLDLGAIEEAALCLEGEHDFYNFSNRRVAEGPTRRNLYRIKIEEEDKGFTVEFTGDGFLYKMVRIIMAYLLKVGHGKIDPKRTNEIILQKDRKYTREVAPPQGLYLEKVFYDKKELKKHLLG
jgi:tRNA pseudouridine38-40 synthase